jgi:hypothetical protein
MQWNVIVLVGGASGRVVVVVVVVVGGFAGRFVGCRRTVEETVEAALLGTGLLALTL